MENLTHSLVGAALAEVALPDDATRAQRTIFFIAGVLGANLPDGDLLYSNVMSPPLGYLLQHRGYTHTVVGCLALAALVGAFGFIPAIRDRLGTSRQRWWAMIVVALLSHITLDWWNSYGVHPFWPFDNRWYYGDAINIFEPLLWMMLGIVVAMNAIRMVTRVAVFLLVAGGVLGIAVVGLIPLTAAIVADGLGVVLAIALWWLPRRMRAAISLGLSATFVVGMFAMNRVARAEVMRSRPAQGGAIVDIILSPTAANPLCWSALTVERDAGKETYTLRRGRVSLFSGGTPRPRCVRESSSTETQSLVHLRQLARDNCRVAAWLQFGRAPAIQDTHIFDYRFGGSNFTDMTFSEGAVACPRYLTPWVPPREDLLAPSS
jgi:inner membrane protein